MSHLVSLSDLNKPLKEAVRGNKVNIEVELSKHTKLHLDDLFLIVSSVTHVDIIFDEWWPNLFILTRAKHCRNSDKLEVFLSNHHLLEVSINHIDGEE